MFTEYVLQWREECVTQVFKRGLVTAHGLDGWGLIPDRSRDFPLWHQIQTGSGVFPVSHPIDFTSSSLQVKWPEHAADYSPVELHPNSSKYIHSMVLKHLDNYLLLPYVCSLRVFENRVLRRIFWPKRDEVIGGWRKLHNEGLHNLYCLPSIIRIIQSRRMRWAGM
jgi:hypothetical protein